MYVEMNKKLINLKKFLFYNVAGFKTDTSQSNLVNIISWI